MALPPFIIRYRLHHLLFWAGIFCVWYYLRYQDYATWQRAFLITLVKVTDLALLVYITNEVLIPRFLYRKKYGLLALCFVSMILVSSYWKMQIIGQIMHNPALFDLSKNLKERVYDNVIPHFFLVTAGAAIKLVYDHSRMQQRLAVLAREKAEAELGFLKSQINPHFLFNSLNTVYFLIDRDNAPARNALHMFSDMLRYQLYEVNGTRIPIEKEVAYLKDYMSLQQLRTGEHYSVEFTCGNEVQGFSIEPLLLIPFVENAFKHLSHHTGRKNYVRVQLEYRKGQFDFHVCNSKEEEILSLQPGGIGLANVKRRLELLYPGRHELLIASTPGEFNVHLALKTGHD